MNEALSKSVTPSTKLELSTVLPSTFIQQPPSSYVLQTVNSDV